MTSIVISLTALLSHFVLAKNTSQRDKVLESLFDNYTSTIPPNYNEDIPTTVYIQVYILSIDSISDISKDYAMSIFLRQRWLDPRLKYDKLPGIESLQLDNKAIENVWTPDLFILNEKKAIVHDVVVPNKLLHIRPDGSILYSIRISGTFSCDVNLLKYPLDHQVCPFVLESYGYSTDNLQLKWYHHPIEKKDDIILSQFTQHGFETFGCDKIYSGMNFSCLTMRIKLDRVYDFYIVQTYIPTILIVILSWVSFWISIDATPARISLGLLTVLTMTTQSTGLTKITYFKAIDVWMISCLCFVFAALIEFAYVNVLSRVAERRRSSIADIPVDDDQPSHSTRNNTTKFKHGSRINFLLSNMANREKARNVDRIARILFPLAFLIFNFIYWIAYVYIVETCSGSSC